MAVNYNIGKISKKEFRKNTESKPRVHYKENDKFVWSSRNAHTILQNLDTFAAMSKDDFIETLYVQFESQRCDGQISRLMTFSEYLRDCIETYEAHLHQITYQRDVQKMMTEDEADGMYEFIRVLQDYCQRHINTIGDGTVKSVVVPTGAGLILAR